MMNSNFCGRCFIRKTSCFCDGLSLKRYYIDERTLWKTGGVDVEDGRIVKLFWERNEQGLREAKLKYGNYCRSIAYGILRSWQDAEECANDT